ncbi:hypothetical protein BKA58DRAFT_455489, partial [Alternaria rosae]|uniref:uncharacterized protein n=1 Tax=Alternaria rosae TaxID=1187941 RepID=UPI001E8E80E8
MHRRSICMERQMGGNVEIYGPISVASSPRKPTRAARYLSAESIAAAHRRPAQTQLRRVPWVAVVDAGCRLTKWAAYRCSRHTRASIDPVSVAISVSTPLLRPLLVRMPAQTEKSSSSETADVAVMLPKYYSQGEEAEPKRTRHSRLSPPPNGRLKQGPLPSPVTHKESTGDASEGYKEGTQSPPPSKPSQARGGLSSPPSDTQPFSQFVYPPDSRTYAVEDEEEEEVWGYLVPMDGRDKDVLVLRRRQACPVPQALVGQTEGTER